MVPGVIYLEVSLLRLVLGVEVAVGTRVAALVEGTLVAAAVAARTFPQAKRCLSWDTAQAMDTFQLITWRL